MQASVGIVAGVGLLLLCALCITYPIIGFYTTYVVCLFLLLPSRLITTSILIPTGLIPEYLSYLTLLGILTKQTYRKEATSTFWSSALMLWTLVLVCYYLFQLLNPSMNSVIGWFNFFRKQVSFAIFIYISYSFFNSRKSIIFFTNFWVALSTIEALYACKQHWFGFFNFEYQWLISDPKRYDLFVNMGFVRMFGLLSDPAAAGILFACGTVLTLALAMRAQTTGKRVLYYLLTIIHFMATSYTGTRTGTLMIVAGVVFYCVLTLYERRTMIFSALFAFLITGLLVVPIYDNMQINRLRSTFEGSKDPSAKTRDLNRALVQPYVWSHPIGGGLNTSGLVGRTYNPGHYLSMIPSDSAYMQTMMEQGPIGLILLLVYYYIIMRTGIRYFYRVKDPELKTLYIAHLVSIFTLLVAQFSQLAIGQYPSVLYFYSVLAIFLKLHTYDSTKNEATV
jgi:putative inorganic carbon (HCO3(-)) transporter